MKTVEQLKKLKIQELDSYRTYANNEPDWKKTKARERKAKSICKHLDNCIMLMELNPREEYLKEQRAELLRVIDLVDEKICNLKNDPNIKSMEVIKQVSAEWKKSYGYSEKMNQLKSINFLLD